MLKLLTLHKAWKKSHCLHGNWIKSIEKQMFPFSKLSKQKELAFSQETGRASGVISKWLWELRECPWRPVFWLKWKWRLWQTAFGCLPATLKSMTANTAAQIVLWLHLWLEDMILKELHARNSIWQRPAFWQGCRKSSCISIEE